MAIFNIKEPAMEIRESVNAVEACLQELQKNHNDVVLYGAGYCLSLIHI